MGAIYIDTNGELKAYIAILRRFGVLEWVETSSKNNVQIRHPKEEVGRLAGNKKVRYHVWIEDVDDHDRELMKELVDAGQEKLVLGKEGTGASCPLAEANSVVMRDRIGLTWRQPQLKRLLVALGRTRRNTVTYKTLSYFGPSGLRFPFLSPNSGKE